MQAVKILKLAFLPWLIKYLQLRVTKSNFPKLPVEEPNWVSFHQSAPSNHSNDGYNWSENEEEYGSEKCGEVEKNKEDSPGWSNFSKKKEKWVPQKVPKLVAIIISIIPFALKVHYE